MLGSPKGVAAVSIVGVPKLARTRTARSMCVALVLAALVAACSSGHGSASTAGHSTTSAGVDSVTSTTIPARAFADALAAGNLQAADATFAENARFYTPVLPDPVSGKSHVIRLVAVLLKTFQGIHITADLQSGDHFALAFDAHIGTEPIHIFDLITFDRTGHIVTFASHGRPYSGIRALALAVGPHIGDILK